MTIRLTESPILKVKEKRIVDDQTTNAEDWKRIARIRELGVIQNALYVAMGAAALIGDEEIIDQLKPIIWRYREKTKSELDGTPYV